ncbi:ROK family protein [Enterococcus sp. LJL98]
MALAVFDIGGSAVKYGRWENQALSLTGQFKTPATFEEMTTEMKAVIASFGTGIEGVAISSPGAVNVDARRIDGISAVEYLHGRPIFDEFEKALGYKITIENDANCAGICEMGLGAGKDIQHAVFVVIGTGVGGAIFINGQLYKGAHLYGGEFGLLLNDNGRTLSSNGTAVNTAGRFSKEIGREITGKELFELKDAGDPAATAALDEMYRHLSESLYNVQTSIDPEMIIIGGGISVRPDVTEEIRTRLLQLLEANLVAGAMPIVKACEFHNDANLIGAALNFENLMG